jgi:hypothetical protein
VGPAGAAVVALAWVIAVVDLAGVTVLAFAGTVVAVVDLAGVTVLAFAAIVVAAFEVEVVVVFLVSFFASGVVCPKEMAPNDNINRAASIVFFIIAVFY